jgi:hypothetical protein
MTPVIDLLVRVIGNAPILHLAWLIARHPELFDFERMP